MIKKNSHHHHLITHASFFKSLLSSYHLHYWFPIPSHVIFSCFLILSNLPKHHHHHPDNKSQKTTWEFLTSLLHDNMIPSPLILLCISSISPSANQRLWNLNIESFPKVWIGEWVTVMASLIITTLMMIIIIPAIESRCWRSWHKDGNS